MTVYYCDSNILGCILTAILVNFVLNTKLTIFINVSIKPIRKSENWFTLRFLSLVDCAEIKVQFEAFFYAAFEYFKTQMFLF